MGEEKVKICWGVKYRPELTGNAYGYRIHNETLLKYVSQIADICDEAKDVVLITSPEFYKNKIEEKRNWLFTMFEGNSLPDIYVEGIKKADFLLTPSTWVKQIFSKYFDPDKIFVVPHGVEPHFYFKERSVPTTRSFRFFYEGAANPRKGYEELIVAWKYGGFVNDNRFELYVKTTGIKNEGIIKNRNVVIDGRNLDRKELVSLYHKAHCFILPSRGEGFGLTLLQAMATGLPCIATNYSGITDFFDETVGYPIGYKMGEGEVTFVGDKDFVKHKTEIAFPNVDELISQMVRIVSDYESALKIGVLASIKAKFFTWNRSAKVLVNQIRREQHGIY